MGTNFLLTNRLGETEVLVRGGSVKVRGLSRNEVVAIRELGLSDTPDIEAHLLSVGIIEPQMSVEDVSTWRELSPAGEYERILNKVTSLSGIGGDDSQAEAQFRN